MSNHYFLASARCDRPAWNDTTIYEKPDFGIYLDDTWFNHTTNIAGCGVFVPTFKNNLPTIIIEWPDASTINQRIFKWLVNKAIEHFKQGEVVDIGCIGGHGRTGTLLAAILGRVENLQPQTAIEEIHKRYCPYAIETIGQFQMVYQSLGHNPDEVFLHWEFVIPKKKEKAKPLVDYNEEMWRYSGMY